MPLERLLEVARIDAVARAFVVHMIVDAAAGLAVAIAVEEELAVLLVRFIARRREEDRDDLERERRAGAARAGGLEARSRRGRARAHLEDGVDGLAALVQVEGVGARLEMFDERLDRVGRVLQTGLLLRVVERHERELFAVFAAFLAANVVMAFVMTVKRLIIVVGGRHGCRHSGRAAENDDAF